MKGGTSKEGRLETDKMRESFLDLLEQQRIIFDNAEIPPEEYLGSLLHTIQTLSQILCTLMMGFKLTHQGRTAKNKIKKFIVKAIKRALVFL